MRKSVQAKVGSAFWSAGIVAAVICAVGLLPGAWADTVILEDIDSGTTSPTGQYRWLDIANQAYSDSYRTTYNYTQAYVQVDYVSLGTVLSGTLTATDLKPNFAYQVKLLGTPGTPANEGVGLAGRWWQEEWNGSEWANGGNLNNKGDGSSPNPNDVVYFQRRDIEDPTSPTGYRYRYTAYLVLDYFVTDGNGAASLDFVTDSSYHVLWKTSQRSPSADDGPEIVSTFDPDPGLHPAYDVDYGESTVSVFGEWERLPVGGVSPRPGEYSVQIMLTEESFHGDGSGYVGSWAAAMGGDIAFALVIHGDFDGDGDVDPSDFTSFVSVYDLSEGDPDWSPNGPIGDFDEDGGVDFCDFMQFVDVYGT